MNIKVILLGLAGFVVLAVLVVAGGCYWYLFGPNSEDSANFLPSGTLIYSSVENGTSLAVTAQTTKLEQILTMQKAKDAMKESWEAIPAEDRDTILKGLSTLSGQSFIAFTGYNVLNPASSSGILGFKPKPGLDTFNGLVDELIKKAPDHDEGTNTFSGISYRWVQPKGGSGAKLCFATVGSWDIATYGEPALQDWINRFQHNLKSPSLGDNAEYRLSMKRLGDRNLVKSFINVPEIINETKLLIPPNATQIPLDKIGAVAVGSNVGPGGYINDRLVWDLPKSAQDSLGHQTDPSAYETEKFTGPESLIYAGGSIDLGSIWQNAKTQLGNNPLTAPGLQSFLQGMQGMGLDMDKNIVQGLGPEASFQMDWTSDQEFPQAALFFKIKDQGAFQPVHTAFDTLTRIGQQAVMPLTVGTQHLTTLSVPGVGNYSPSYTTDGPYFALFTSKEEAQKCFQQDGSKTLAIRPEFSAPGGNILGHSSQAAFVDFPQITQNVAHSHSIMDFLASKDEDKMLHDALADPDQLKSLTSLGVWTGTSTWDDDGMIFDSTSGVGNLPILMASVAAVGQQPGALESLSTH